MLKIKLTSAKNIKPIKFNCNSYLDPKFPDIYKLIPEEIEFTLWINNINCGRGNGQELIEFFDQEWGRQISKSKAFKTSLKACIETGKPHDHTWWI